eukprot:Hpha_TRINITY_DN11446_c0_g1::TRINITY_DN11446_c0_g1_i1::g.137337::m.137337
MLAVVLGAIVLGALNPEPCQRTDIGSTNYTCGTQGSVALKRELRLRLFRNFTVNQTLRDPAAGPGNTPRPLQFRMLLHRMNSFSPKSSAYIADITVIHEFFDPRWCWNPADWCNETFLHQAHVLQEDVWLPKFFIEQAQIDPTNAGIFINYTGKVVLRLRAKISFNCFMNFRYFPFDKQDCFNQMGAYGQLPSDIQYELADEPLRLDPGLWQNSIDVYVVSQPELILIQGEQALDNGNYVPLQLAMTFTRVRSRHVMNIFFPIWLVNVLSILGLYIDAVAAPARVTMAVITVLVLINLQNKLSDELPNLAYTSAMDLYFVVCLLMTISNAGEYAVINYLNTSLRQLKADIEQRKQMRKKMVSAKLSLRDGDIGVVRFPVTLREDVECDMGKSICHDGFQTGVLAAGDILRVLQVKPMPDKPSETCAKVRVIHSKDRNLIKVVGTVLVSVGDQAMIVCDWHNTTAQSIRREDSRRPSRTSGIGTGGNLITNISTDEEVRTEPFEPFTPHPSEDSTVSVLECTQEHLKTKQEESRDTYLKATARKRMAEIWDSYVLFLEGGDAAHEDDVVALLHHYADINPRMGQRWVDAASSVNEDGEEDDLVDFQEFRDSILPQLEEHMSNNNTKAEPQALEFLCGTIMTGHTISNLEERYRWSAVAFFLGFNAVFFIITIVMAG